MLPTALFSRPGCLKVDGVTVRGNNGRGGGSGGYRGRGYFPQTHDRLKKSLVRVAAVVVTQCFDVGND